MARDRTKAPPRKDGARTKPAFRRPGNGVPQKRAHEAKRVAPETPATPPGLYARVMAVDMLDGVLGRRKTLDEALGAAQSGARQRELPARDRAFARLLAATVLRHHGRLSAVVSRFLERPLPREARRAELILLSAAAQLLLLGTPGHAAIHLAVEQARYDRKAERYHKLANAVLRKVGAEGPAILATIDPVSVDVPPWLLRRWADAYGSETARRIAEASLVEAALDVTSKEPDGAAGWAERLQGVVLPTGTIRLAEHGTVEELAGFDEGAWWVQDAAASLPARLLGDVTGKRVADLCAAPGGKTAQLASRGARVVAVDHASARLGRLDTNMRRLGFSDRVATIQADILDWRPAEPFDAVLLDAPCTATGTIRRHPDLLHLKSEADIERVAKLQTRMLSAAGKMIAPGGTLVYCTCSLEPEEGERQIEHFLGDHPAFVRVPITPADVGGVAAWITLAGDLRTLPHQLPLDAPFKSGMDGFYAARLIRKA